MRVFVTGASGWIGSAVVPNLLAAGHRVVGLARSDSSAKTLSEAGVEVVRGSLTDLDVLREAAASVDGVLHLAFDHQVAFTGDFAAAAASDLAAVQAMGEALVGTGRPLVIAGGTPIRSGAEIPDETYGHDPATAANPAESARAATAEWVLALAERGVRSSVVRMPPTNHGVGDSGFIPTLIQAARDRGVSGYIGDGSHAWSATHRIDTARVFQLALEEAPAGSTLHAVAEESISTREIAEQIGRLLDLPVQSVDPDQAFDHFGWVAMAFVSDRAAYSARTRKLLGWEPQEVGLLQDLAENYQH